MEVKKVERQREKEKKVKDGAHKRSHNGSEAPVPKYLQASLTSFLREINVSIKLKFEKSIKIFDYQVARQAACYQAAMEQLVRLDIPKALPILAQYLTVMSDLIVHPDAR